VCPVVELTLREGRWTKRAIIELIAQMLLYAVKILVCFERVIATDQNGPNIPNFSNSLMFHVL
jgi:hypothetical protein